MIKVSGHTRSQAPLTFSFFGKMICTAENSKSANQLSVIRLVKRLGGISSTRSCPTHSEADLSACWGDVQLFTSPLLSSWHSAPFVSRVCYFYVEMGRFDLSPASGSTVPSSPTYVLRPQSTRLFQDDVLSHFDTCFSLGLLLHCITGSV